MCYLIGMNTQTTSPPARLADLTWLCGPWVGALGDQIAEENWSKPSGGSMSTMVRLTGNNETIMLELILIRETEDTLIAHLRQFGPTLELRLEQDMPLVEIGENRISFIGPSDSSLTRLTYRGVAEDRMEVDVMFGPDTEVTAKFQRGSHS